MDFEILKQIPIFSSLADNHLEKIAEIVEKVTFPKGTTIFKQGDPGDAFYIIINGKVKVVKKDENGEEKTLAILRDTEFFGEMALLEETPRSATLVAIEDSTMYKITKKNFSFIMVLNPAISLKIMRYMSERMRKTPALQKGEIAEKEAKIFTVFSPRGGSGKTLLAVNFAAAIARKPDIKVLLMDLDLEFGDVAVFLNINKSKTLTDIAREVRLFSYENVEPYISKVQDNFHVLVAPYKPEEAELVKVKMAKELLDLFKGYYDYIVIDTPSSFTDHALMALDLATKIMLVFSSDVPSIKNVKLALDAMRSLDYPEEKISLLLNREEKGIGLTREAIESHLKLKIAAVFPENREVARTSIDRGIPFVKNEASDNLSRAVLDFIGSTCGIKFEFKEKSGFAKILEQIQNIFARKN